MVFKVACSLISDARSLARPPPPLPSPFDADAMMFLCSLGLQREGKKERAGEQRPSFSSVGRLDGRVMTEGGTGKDAAAVNNVL